MVRRILGVYAQCPRTSVVRARRIRSILARVRFLALIPAVFPLVIVVLLLRRVWLVRFGYFYGDRIGHLVFDSAHYLSGLAQRGREEAFSDFFFLKNDICNKYWSSFLRRNLVLSSLAEPMYHTLKRIPGASQHLIQPFRDTHGYGFPKNDSEVHEAEWEYFRKAYEFNDKETAQGRNFLREIGLHNPERLVCLNVRDGAYLNNTIPRTGGWNYHSYRDSDIQAYELISRRLGEAGYFVVRMGKTVQEKFICDASNVFDYANSEYRSDFLDIWLAANCAFMISTGSGLDSVAITFGRPVAFVNAMPLKDINYWTSCIWSPKHLFWEDGRRLSVLQHLRNGFRNLEDYELSGIVIKDLSAEEISSSVFELVNNLEGKVDDDAIRLNRQKAFWQLFFSETGYTQSSRYATPCMLSGTFLDSTELE